MVEDLKAEKRYWFRYADGVEWIESAPAAVFDDWAASALLREGLVESTQRFGAEADRPAPRPVVRYEKFCGNAVTDWLKHLIENPQITRRRLTGNFKLPAHYPLSGFIATRYADPWQFVPSLIQRWESLTRPAVLILDGLTVPHNQSGLIARQTHAMLVRLTRDIRFTACYGPVVCARLSQEGIDVVRPTQS